MSRELPFTVLTMLAKRSEEVSRELPAQENTQTHWTGVGFSLLGQRFVVSMEEVAELMRVPHATRIPGVKNYVVGIANIRGRLMAVVDLAMVFGGRSSLARAQRRVVAFESEESYLGFIMEESLGMQHFPSDSYNEESGELDEMFKPFVSGSYRAGGIVWPIISLAALAKDPNLEKLAMAAG